MTSAVIHAVGNKEQLAICVSIGRIQGRASLITDIKTAKRRRPSSVPRGRPPSTFFYEEMEDQILTHSSRRMDPYWQRSALDLRGRILIGKGLHLVAVKWLHVVWVVISFIHFC